LLEEVDNPLASLSADGAYDAEGVYEAALSSSEGGAVRILIPPGRDAQLAPRPSPALDIIGRCMRSRTFDGQLVEVHLASKILNTMTLLGMPDSYRVA
jgi:hypothetical protein